MSYPHLMSSCPFYLNDAFQFFEQVIKIGSHSDIILTIEEMNIQQEKPYLLKSSFCSLRHLNLPIYQGLSCACFGAHHDSHSQSK